ncbi:uncharacterized protein LOC123873159 [Maniola jurtina]|uniref:uncharacterized protein LOC123873159 n=1 Tax=Maniola jurtina TaxID=191418 RepID=UPI001E68A631|nr:uncharacterized protein LOC123873159 [Maniola jurtina]
MSEKTEKELIKTRASFKGRLTAFCNHLKSIGDSLNPVQVTELQLRLGKLDNLYQQFDEVQLRIECLVDDIDTVLPERIEFESTYFKVLARAQDLIAQNTETANEGLCSEKGSSKRGSQLVKLPTIALPKFSGSFNNWLEFRDTFSSLVHSNEDISDINKFHYLRASLEGTAAIVIQSIELSAANYSVAWSLLCERFDNKRLLIQNHVSALFNIESVSQESSENLKRLIDSVNKNIRALESLGEPTLHWDTLLIHMLSKKLDSKTFREWEEFKGRLPKDTYIKLDSLLEFLRNRADLLQNIETSRVKHSPNKPKSNFTKHKSLVSSVEPKSENSVQSRSCPKCQGDHFLQNCRQFQALSEQERRKILPQFKICFCCFRPGHLSTRCWGQRCRKCGRRHNIMICTAGSQRTPSGSHSQDDKSPTGAMPNVEVRSNPPL